MKVEFDAERAGSGTVEWAEVNENICRGCPNNCLYCYAAYNADRFKQRPRTDWHREELTKRAVMKSYPAKDGIVMFPSSHDITPFNLWPFIRTAELILKSGNRLLIVSKPRRDCIPTILRELAPWKEQILFRFTIGSDSQPVCAFWEPGAPSPGERIACLSMAKANGYKTSVSIEPMLEGARGAISTVESVRPFVTETIWIGKMNKPWVRVPKEYADAVLKITYMQSDHQILELYQSLKDDPMIRWKDSIKEVVTRHSSPASSTATPRPR